MNVTRQPPAMAHFRWRVRLVAVLLRSRLLGRFLVRELSSKDRSRRKRFYLVMITIFLYVTSVHIYFHYIFQNYLFSFSFMMIRYVGKQLFKSIV